MKAPTTIAPSAEAPPIVTSRPGDAARRPPWAGLHQIRSASRTTAIAADVKQYPHSAPMTVAEIHVRYAEKPTAPAAIANAHCQRVAVSPAAASPATAA